MLGARVMSECEKYPGLPIASGKSNVGTFKELQEKITKRVMGWKEKFISKADREILIKTVVQAIPTYSMSLFKLPKTICDNINSLLVKYWWGQSKEERKINWINWGKLCTHKKKGGMRFRDPHTFNLAMLAKQVWRLIHNTQSLFYQVYKVRYFPYCSFMSAELGNNPSFVWRSLLQAKDIIQAGSRWQIGDGATIGVSAHKWLTQAPVFFLNEPSEALGITGLEFTLVINARQISHLINLNPFPLMNFTVNPLKKMNQPPFFFPPKKRKISPSLYLQLTYSTLCSINFGTILCWAQGR